LYSEKIDKKFISICNDDKTTIQEYNSEDTDFTLHTMRLNDILKRLEINPDYLNALQQEKMDNYLK